MKRFNTTGTCFPNKHYMVDLTERVAAIRAMVDNGALFSGYVTWYPNEHWGFDLFGRYEFEESQVEEVGGWVQYSWDCLALRLIGSVEPAYTNEYGEEEETDWKITLTGWLTDFVPAKILEEDNR